ncbi:hypothetical protein J0K78_11100 [Halobacillus sp. GSS1]|uniref:hypothetical protein n=1 Tax=Halobacillus sp. GSS1 TaxID=2815919 RepID=UPI001A8F378E|nr:hypothetical protein [Halobacillus sp. GSS1]MBN9654813.1 hypothetical protein [Halobacillus sp. GSS1]
MDLFTKNYWGVYLDFLDDFSDLVYKGYPIAYLCHYRSLIRENEGLMGKLETAAFTKALKNKRVELTSIQTRFNAFKSEHQKTWRRGKGGKIVFHDVHDLLRVPEETFLRYFDKKKTLIIEEKGMKEREESFSRVKGFDYQYFSEYSEDASEAIKLMKKKAKQILHSFPGHPMYSDETFKERFLIQVMKIVNRINESILLLKKVNISAIVVASTHYPESRTLVMVAAKNGIPTVCLQHGIISGEIGYLPKVADIDAVYGQFEMDWYKERGAKEKGAEIIGHPRFDLISKPPTISREELENQLGLDASKKNVLLIVRGHANYTSWDQFLKKITVKQNLNIVLKDFPNHKVHPLTKSQKNLFRSPGRKLHDLIHMSDVVVTYFSTVALEAMIAGKVVFILDQPFGGYSGYFSKMGDLVQEDPGKLASIFSDYFLDNKVKVYAEQMVKSFLSTAYHTHKNSGERLSTLLKQLL